VRNAHQPRRREPYFGRDLFDWHIVVERFPQQRDGSTEAIVEFPRVQLGTCEQKIHRLVPRDGAVEEPLTQLDPALGVRKISDRGEAFTRDGVRRKQEGGDAAAHAQHRVRKAGCDQRGAAQVRAPTCEEKRCIEPDDHRSRGVSVNADARQ
jgi:hypothetical protein